MLDLPNVNLFDENSEIYKLAAPNQHSINREFSCVGTPSLKICSFPLFLGKRSLFPWMAEFLSDELVSCVSYSLYFPVFGAKEVLSVDE